MKRVLITGAGSYVGTHVMEWLLKDPENFHVEAVDTFGDNWKKADYSKFDVVYHVAGIAEVDGKKGMEELYYKVNTDLTIEIAKHAKAAGIKQFIFMSSMIVYKETQSLKPNIVTQETKPAPNAVYGDSKLKAEMGLHKLESASFKVCILRPPMIYGPNSKSNLQRLGALGIKLPVFPSKQNKRSMLYIDNLSEFVKQAIINELFGTFYPQNKEFGSTVEIIRFFAKKYNHKIWITSLLNPFVIIGSWFLQPVPKMFADSYYVPEMSKYDFDYQLVSFEDSMNTLEV